jgi:hypothetical protein
MFIHQNKNKINKCKGQQYIIHHIYHNYQTSLFNTRINKSFNSYHLCHRHLLSHFPRYLIMGKVGMMGAKSITVC